MITLDEIKEIVDIREDPTKEMRFDELQKKIKENLSFKLIKESKHPLLFGIAIFHIALKDIEKLPSENIDSDKHEKEKAKICELIEYAFYAFARLSKYSDSIISDEIDEWASAAQRMHFILFSYTRYIRAFVRAYIMYATDYRGYLYTEDEVYCTEDYMLAYVINYNYYVHQNGFRYISMSLSGNEYNLLNRANESRSLLNPLYFMKESITKGKMMVYTLVDTIDSIISATTDADDFNLVHQNIMNTYRNGNDISY